MGSSSLLYLQLLITLHDQIESSAQLSHLLCTIEFIARCVTYQAHSIRHTSRFSIYNPLQTAYLDREALRR